jgi:F-type H+-transporting ATPase subunit a
MGLVGYFDHLAGKPRGAIAFSAILPVFFFALHVISELLRPLSLSLRLRSNIWGDELLLAMLTGFGFKGLLILFWNTLTTLLTATIQAVVFCLLSAIYFALILTEE